MKATEGSRKVLKINLFREEMDYASVGSTDNVLDAVLIQMHMYCLFQGKTYCWGKTETYGQNHKFNV